MIGNARFSTQSHPVGWCDPAVLERDLLEARVGRGLGGLGDGRGYGQPAKRHLQGLPWEST